MSTIEPTKNAAREPAATVRHDLNVELVQAEFTFLREVSGFCRLIQERIVERDEIIKMLLSIPMTKWHFTNNVDGTTLRECLSASHKDRSAITYEVAMQIQRNYSYEESDSRPYGKISYHVASTDKLEVFDLAPFPALIKDCFATIKSKLGEAEYFENQAAPLIAEIRERIRNSNEVFEVIKSLPLDRTILIENAPALLRELAYKLVDSYDRECQGEGWYSLEEIAQVVKLSSERHQAFLMSIKISFHGPYGDTDRQSENLIVIYDKQNSNAKKVYFTLSEPFHAGMEKEFKKIWSMFEE
jgi:hypothetical protein